MKVNGTLHHKHPLKRWWYYHLCLPAQWWPTDDLYSFWLQQYSNTRSTCLWVRTNKQRRAKENPCLLENVKFWSSKEVKQRRVWDLCTYRAINDKQLIDTPHLFPAASESVRSLHQSLFWPCPHTSSCPTSPSVPTPFKTLLRQRNQTFSS